MQFFKLINALGKLGTGILAVLFSFLIFNQYFFTYGDQLQRLEQLYEAQSITHVVLDTNYKEVDVTIKGIDVNFYEVQYSYEVGGSEYSGSYKFDEEEDIFDEDHQVYYLPEDPATHQLNLEAELEEARENNSSSFGLFLGIGILLFGIYMIYLGQKKFKENRRESKKNKDDFGMEF